MLRKRHFGARRTGGGAVGLGAFTLACRTLDTVWTDLADLSVPAARFVAVASASPITLLSWIDIPAGPAVSATTCIVGLGWGRATRSVTIGAVMRGEGPRVSADGLAGDDPGDSVGSPTGRADDPGPAEVFDPGTTGRVVVCWVVTPTLSAVASYLVFASRVVP